MNASIDRLQSYTRPNPDLSSTPSSSLAAVLVLLFPHANSLRVLLTTRSKSLRSHPGDTALPGGKVDPEDGGPESTAYREAHEEVGLPLAHPAIRTLTLLEPFLSQSRLLVTPVIALLTDPGLLDTLNPSADEVARVFDHPLEALLDPTLSADESLSPQGSEDWIYDEELHSTADRLLPGLDGAVYRMHRFRTSASPIKGLTSDILIKTAEIAYGRAASYERYAPGQRLNAGYDATRRLLDACNNTTGHLVAVPAGAAIAARTSNALPAV